MRNNGVGDWLLWNVGVAGERYKKSERYKTGGRYKTGRSIVGQRADHLYMVQFAAGLPSSLAFGWLRES